MAIGLRTTLFEASAPPETSSAVRALGFATTPTNQQILEAAKAAYGKYQPAVDATTIALTDSVKDSSLAEPLIRLDGTNWSSPGLTPALIDPFRQNVYAQTALGVVRQSDLASFSVGVFAKSIPADGPGVIGFATEVAGSATAGMILDLNIFGTIVSVDNTRNLQYGVWLDHPPDVHDYVLGFYTNATVQGVDVNLKILVDKTLSPYGFVASTGAKVPVSSGVFAGSTAQWAS